MPSILARKFGYGYHLKTMYFFILKKESVSDFFQTHLIIKRQIYHNLLSKLIFLIARKQFNHFLKPFRIFSFWCMNQVNYELNRPYDYRNNEINFPPWFYRISLEPEFYTKIYGVISFYLLPKTWPICRIICAFTNKNKLKSFFYTKVSFLE